MNEWTAHVAATAPTIVGQGTGDEIGDDTLDEWFERPGAGAITAGHGRVEVTFTAFGDNLVEASGYAIDAVRESFGGLVDEILSVEAMTHGEADRASGDLDRALTAQANVIRLAATAGCSRRHLAEAADIPLVTIEYLIDNLDA